MKQQLIKAATTLNNTHVLEWKAQGKKIIGYTCSHFPDELVYAADILPCRIRGFGAEELTIGDTYFGPFICSLPKAMLQLAGEGRFSFLDGAIITPGCDSMRRLDECWRKSGEDIPGTVPQFFFHFGVPHKFTDYSLKWFVDEIHRLKSAIEEHFNMKISEEKISAAIRLYNKSRDLIDEFDTLRTADNPLINGSDALAVTLASTSMPRQAYVNLLENFISDIRTSGDTTEGRIRLMLIGSASDDISFLRMIEGNRAVVVADTICFGSRSQIDHVSENGDPLKSLAERYLSKNECPRMYGQFKGRLKMLRDKIKNVKADGVILQNIRFCDLHGSENGLFERELEKDGIPCLKIEREYGPLVETGRLKMRIDALLERIEKRR